MKKYQGIKYFALLAVLVAGGCSDALYQKSGDTTIFRDNKTDGTVFFTAVYDNPDDKPMFEDIFRAHADLGYVGDINDAEYADVRLQTGRHTLTVDRIDWTGYNVGTSTITVDLAAGQTLFLEERVHADDKITLSILDAKQGTQNIVTRRRICNCGNMLGIDF